MSVIAVRLNDGRAVLLGFAFSVMAVLLVFHALATPGVLIGENGLVQAAGALNVPLGGLILAASALPSLRRPRSAATVLRIQLVTLVVLVLIGTAGLVFDGLIPAIPRYESVFAQLIFVAGGADARVAGLPRRAHVPADAPDAGPARRRRRRPAGGRGVGPAQQRHDGSHLVGRARVRGRRHRARRHPGGARPAPLDGVAAADRRPAGGGPRRRRGGLPRRPRCTR